MNALLDTHVWIWLLEDPSKIAAPVLRQLESADALVLSAATIWEIAIKAELGRLVMKGSPAALRDEILREMHANELAIGAEHACAPPSSRNCTRIRSTEFSSRRRRSST